MNTERARELLPWFLNGTLEADEREELLATLREDEELRRELAETQQAGEIFGQHVPAADLVAHVFGERVGLEHARIEAHVALCERCAEEVALVHESRTLSAGDRAGEPIAVPEDRRQGRLLTFLRSNLRPYLQPAAAGPSTRWQAAALAASLVALVGLGGWAWSWQQTEGRVAALEGRITDLVVSMQETSPPLPPNQYPPIDRLGLVPDVMRSGGRQSLASGSRNQSYELWIDPDEELDPGTDVTESYELRVIDPSRESDERVLWRAFPATLTPGDQRLMFRVPARSPGEYDFELYRLTPRGWELIERYSVPVDPKD